MSIDSIRDESVVSFPVAEGCDGGLVGSDGSQLLRHLSHAPVAKLLLRHEHQQVLLILSPDHEQWSREV